MQKMKLKALIEDSNILVADLNLYLEELGVVNKYDKKKEYSQKVSEFAKIDSEVSNSIFEVGLRTLLLEHLERRELCKKM